MEKFEDKLQFLNGALSVDFNEVMTKINSHPEEIVILSGTLVEGIGNCYSDLDIYVITDELPEITSHGKHNYISSYGSKIKTYYDNFGEDGLGFDVEYFTFEEVKNIIKKLEKLYLEARSHTKIFRKTLDIDESDALHKIIIGHVLQGEEHLNTIFDKPKIKDKLSFLNYRNVVGGYPEFRDIMGAYISRDFETALKMTDGYLVAQLMGLYHLTGVSNNKLKWHMKYTDRLPKEYSELVISIKDWFFSDKTNIQDAILKACDIIEGIWRDSRLLLDRNAPNSYDCREALDLINQELAKEVIHDVQTIIEFEHRKTIFAQNTWALREYLTHANEIIEQVRSSKA